MFDCSRSESRFRGGVVLLVMRHVLGSRHPCITLPNREQMGIEVEAALRVSEIEGRECSAEFQYQVPIHIHELTKLHSQASTWPRCVQYPLPHPVPESVPAGRCDRMTRGETIISRCDDLSRKDVYQRHHDFSETFDSPTFVS